MHAPLSTLRSQLSSAEICRRNGWCPGTVLAGELLPNEQGPGPIIQITALGNSAILATQLDERWQTIGDELVWNLHARQWRAKG